MIARCHNQTVCREVASFCDKNILQSNMFLSVEEEEVICVFFTKVLYHYGTLTQLQRVKLLPHCKNI